MKFDDSTQNCTEVCQAYQVSSGKLFGVHRNTFFPIMPPVVEVAVRSVMCVHVDVSWQSNRTLTNHMKRIRDMHSTQCGLVRKSVNYMFGRWTSGWNVLRNVGTNHEDPN